MHTIKVAIRFIDGGMHEYSENPNFIKELRSLQSQGYIGRELINCLISDDWGAPPTVVNISGHDEDGAKVDFVIPYT